MIIPFSMRSFATVSVWARLVTNPDPKKETVKNELSLS